MLHALVLTLALAAPKDSASREAERLVKQSIVDYNVGDFDAALEEVTKAYKIKPAAGLLFNLAQCHRALHHWERAEFFYRGYLREKPDAPNRDTVEQLISEMENKQAQNEIASHPPQAVVPATPPPVLAPAPLADLPPSLTLIEAHKAPGRNHTLSYALLGVGGVAVVVTLIGIAGCVGWNNYRNGLHSGNVVQYTGFESQANTAQIFSGLLIGGVVVAAGSGTGALLTW